MSSKKYAQLIKKVKDDIKVLKDNTSIKLTTIETKTRF